MEMVSGDPSKHPWPDSEPLRCLRGSAVHVNRGASAKKPERVRFLPHDSLFFFALLFLPVPVDLAAFFFFVVFAA
jgi:hypothetical protein